MTFLAEALNVSVFQIGGGMHHYAGGEIADADEDRFELINAVEHEPFAFISSKRALVEYESRDLLNEYVKPALKSDDDNLADVEQEYVVRNLAKVLSSNAFETESLGAAFATPFPGDSVITRWAHSVENSWNQRERERTNRSATSRIASIDTSLTIRLCKRRSDLVVMNPSGRDLVQRYISVLTHSRTGLIP